jgi:hypothetical protein
LLHSRGLCFALMDEAQTRGQLADEDFELLFWG